MRAFIIVDLGFGDAGKGLLTDYLVRKTNAGLVVRYNGGAQAGHHVVTPDGRRHTFAQFGSGSFNPGVRTFLSSRVVIHPAALLTEGDLLQANGEPDIYDRLRISAGALVITPFHQGANRIRELVRGASRHGSCGVGVGEAVDDSLAYPQESIHAGDLAKPARLKHMLHRIRDRKRAEMLPLYRDAPDGSPVAREGSLFEQSDVIDRWLSSIERISHLDLIAGDDLLASWLKATGTVVFEGAQGVLLDAEAGFHPYTTWANTTSRNALDLLGDMAPGVEVVQVGVTRSYMVRHGPGPLPTETGEFASYISEHNQAGEWQGPLRYGWFDPVLLRYALSVNGGVDQIAVTHLDLLPHLKEWKYALGYKWAPLLQSSPVELDTKDEIITGIHLPGRMTLAAREQFTQALSAARPVLAAGEAGEAQTIRQIELSLLQEVNYVARGPASTGVQALAPFDVST